MHFSWLFSKVWNTYQKNIVYISRDFSQKSQKCIRTKLFTLLVTFLKTTQTCIRKTCSHFSWLFSNISNMHQKNMFTLLMTFLKHLKNVSERIVYTSRENSKKCIRKKCLHFSWLSPKISRMYQKHCLHFSWLFSNISKTY